MLNISGEEKKNDKEAGEKEKKYKPVHAEDLGWRRILLFLRSQFMLDHPPFSQFF